MQAGGFYVRYEGGDADGNVVDMRLLAESLAGLDRIVSDGLIVLALQRLPKRGERAPLILKAREPIKGSVNLPFDWHDIQGVLALGVPIVQAIGTDFVSNWIQSVIYRFSGKKDLADRCMEHIAELNRDHLAARDRADERAHIEHMRTLDLFSEAISRLGPPAASLAAPVGPSVRALEFGAGTVTRAVIDEPTAEALREHAIIEWGDPQSMMLRTDGFTFHTGRLSVEHPMRPGGYLSAEVVDPAFRAEGNVYTQAAQKKAIIRVLAKPGYRNDNLVALTIMHFEALIDDVG